MIEFKKNRSVATIIIKNEKKLNAIDRQSWENMAEIINAVDNDDALRCVVFRGAGDDAFSAGADISEFPTIRYNSQQAAIYGENIANALNAILLCRHPTVAMIKGSCHGGGLEIAICCDIRLASLDSSFGIPINKIGHGFPPSEMAPLLSLVGRGVMFELLLEGRIFSAEEALMKGLINRIAENDELEQEVNKTIERIITGAPQSVRSTKRIANLFYSGANITAANMLEVFATCDTADYREGVKAFLERRKPKFSGL